jgi:aryl-alcohol dehydrogenase-like predicted oxidoreductase
MDLTGTNRGAKTGYRASGDDVAHPTTPGVLVEKRPFGATRLSVSAVGLGAGRIGGPGITDADVDRLVGGALDAGVTLIDTARSYGFSEERLGRALAGRRERVVLSTKVGYGVPGVPDWTPRCIAEGVDAALGRLRTDRLDIVHLHSCELSVLEHGGVAQALRATVEAGKVRVAAYSGEGEALLWAVRSGLFGGVQCSVSIVDQAVLDDAVPEAQSRGIGVLAKRALGNAPWRFDARPAESDVAEAWDRFRVMRPDAGGLSWAVLFTRFAAHAPGVSAVLIGTASLSHLKEAVAAVEQGPLDPRILASLRAVYAAAGRSWSGRI